MDRSAKGDERRKKMSDLQADVMTAEDYIEGKAEARQSPPFCCRRRLRAKWASMRTR